MATLTLDRRRQDRERISTTHAKVEAIVGGESLRCSRGLLLPVEAPAGRSTFTRSALLPCIICFITTDVVEKGLD